MTTRKLQTYQSGKNVPIESENEVLDFSAIRIGPSKGVISELDVDTIQISKKIRAVAGTDASDFATKGQVDNEATRAGNAETALDGRLDTAEATLISLDGRLDTTETNIGSLQVDLASILANNPKQGSFIVGVGGQSVFDVSSLVAPQSAFSFDALSTVFDIEMLVNGKRLVQCRVGDFSTGGFKKNSTVIVETSESIPENAEVIIWKQGTNSAGGGGANLDAIVTNPAPAVAAGNSLGTLPKPWSGLYLKDTVTAQVYLLQIVNGVVDFTAVP